MENLHQVWIWKNKLCRSALGSSAWQGLSDSTDCWWDVKNQIKQTKKQIGHKESNQTNKLSIYSMHALQNTSAKEANNMNPDQTAPKGAVWSGSIWASMRKNLSSGVCEQHRRRPAWASAQSDQRLCCSLFGKYHMKTCYRWSINFLASLCSWGDWFETRFVGHSEDRVFHLQYRQLLDLKYIPAGPLVEPLKPLETFILVAIL